MSDQLRENKFHFDCCLDRADGYDFGQDGYLSDEPLGTAGVSTKLESHIYGLLLIKIINIVPDDGTRFF